MTRMVDRNKIALMCDVVKRFLNSKADVEADSEVGIKVGVEFQMLTKGGSIWKSTIIGGEISISNGGKKIKCKSLGQVIDYINESV